MNLTLILVGGSLILMSLAVVIILFVIMHQRRMFRHQMELKLIEEQKQHELLIASMQGEEEERSRVAMELHDDVAMTLATAKLYLAKLSKSMPESEVAEKATGLLDDSILKIRNISHRLQPSVLQYNGLQTALSGMIELINNSEKLNINPVIEGKIPKLDDKTELSLYRIVQELMNNILKHSGATEVTLDGAESNTRVSLTMIHDGKGLTQEQYEDLIYKKGAIGLKNIVNRLKLIHGTIQFSRIGEQNEIVISVPY